jgi:transposase
MEILYDRCAGLDVHKKTVVACLLSPGPDGRPLRRLRTFGTTTAELLALADWLAEHDVRHVALEATGVYWQPVWHLLEDRFELLLVNAQHIKRVPGRKTDLKDAEWLAQLLQHGLLTASFVPPAPIRELRDLTRQRAQLVRQRAAVANRIQKVLEGANIKLAGVVTDVLGKSGRAMIRALIDGRTDPRGLAGLARGSLRGKQEALAAALHGRVTGHHRFVLGALMDQVGHLEGLIGRYDERIAEAMGPLAEQARRIATIPGVGPRAAEVIVAGIGTDMSRFPTPGHLSSWAGMSPGNDVSAGKRRSGRTTKGSSWLRGVLVQVAWAAARSKGTGLQASYRRWSRRRGAKRALVAVGHKVLVLIHLLLSRGQDYEERSAPAQAA